jgi:hypothetical protein
MQTLARARAGGRCYWLSGADRRLLLLRFERCGGCGHDRIRMWRRLIDRTCTLRYRKLAFTMHDGTIGARTVTSILGGL